jgi:MOSC domain-containing protein YiiM
MHQYDGTVLGVASDPQHSFSKPPKRHITLIEDHGVEGDAHAGKYVRHRFIARVRPRQPNKRQVHLIRAELFKELREAGYVVGPGDLGENVTTAGLMLEHLPLGTRLHLGRGAVVELTGLRTPCGLINRFQNGLRSEMTTRSGTPKFKCGVLGVVIVGGHVVPGDTARVQAPPEPSRSLPPM